MHAELYFNSGSSLKQQSGDRYVAPLWHVILIPSQPVFDSIWENVMYDDKYHR